jgi:hypothetical protein
MVNNCAICDSKFANKECYFCQSKICSSCIAPSDITGRYTTKCINCDRNKINTVYPIPFLQVLGYNIPATAFQPVLITTAIMVIPFIFMFIAWQRRGS